MSYQRISRITGAGVLAAALVLGSVGIGAGISGSGYFGEISRFRSIVIGPEHFETPQVSVYIDGQEATMDDLYPGQRVFAELDPSRKRAETLRRFSGVSGQIDTIEAAVNSDFTHFEISVHGQLVIADENTIIHGGEESTLVEGAWIAVDGYRNESQHIQASAIVLNPVMQVPTISGYVEELKNMNFEIAGTRIAAHQFVDPGGEPWLTDGQPISVALDIANSGSSRTAVSITPIPEQFLLPPVISLPKRVVRSSIAEMNDDKSVLTLNDGQQVRLKADTKMLDRRDGHRFFGPPELQVGDSVKLVLALTPDQPEIRILTRVP